MSGFYRSHDYTNITFNLEYTPSHLYSGAQIGSAPNSRGTFASVPSSSAVYQSQNQRRNSSNGASVTSLNSPSPCGSGVGMVSSPTITSHLDAVVDLGILKIPYPLIVSAGRDGVVKIWK
jgi:phosphoinositide-3-kinase, regulatory subunit 4